MKSEQYLYQEKQFVSPKIKLILILHAIIIVIVTALLLYKSQIPTTKNICIIAAIITTETILLIIINSARLKTQIYPDRIQCQLKPLMLKPKTIKFNQISAYFIRQYSPIRDFGGWGIRLSMKGSGRAYNIKGNIGLQIMRKDHTLILIGTQKPQELLNALLKQIPNEHKPA